MIPVAKRCITGKNNGEPTMLSNENTTRWGKIRYGIAALLLGLPLPIVLIAFLAPGCNR